MTLSNDDYQEVTVWNQRYLQEYKVTSKSWVELVTGTMPDFHLYIQKSPLLLFIAAFFRSFGCYFFVSNPLLGFILWLEVLRHDFHAFIMVSIGVLSAILFAYYLKMPPEMINNGLFQMNNVLLSFFIWWFSNDHYKFILPMIILNFMCVILFQAGIELLVVTKGISPGFTPSLICIWLFCCFTTHSKYFDIALSPGLSKPLEEGDIGFSWTLLWETVCAGVSWMLFSDDLYSAIPITVGLFIASPISCANMWMGSLLATLSAYAIGIPATTLRNNFNALNGLLVFVLVNGFWFVPSKHSFILSTWAVMIVAIVYSALESFTSAIGASNSGWPAAIVTISIYACRLKFSRLIAVDLMNMTTPEDHLRRSRLTYSMLHILHLGKDKLPNITPERQKTLHQTLIPILLCSYIKENNLKGLQRMLELKADPNLADYDGRVPLHIAAMQNDMVAVKTLLKYQADVNSKDRYESTPLWEALEHGHLELAKFLYSKGAKMQRDVDVSTKLCTMASKNDAEGLQAWLDCGADPNLTDYDGRTALHVATNFDNHEAVDVLKAHAADAEIEDRWGLKAADTGAGSVTELVECQELPRQPTFADLPRSPTFTEHATFIPILQSAPTIRAKLDKDTLMTVIFTMMDCPDESLKNSLLPSLLLELISIGDMKLLHQVLYRGIDVTMSDYDGRTLLHLAASSENLELVRTLVWNGCDVNAKDRLGNTPLLEALQNHHDNICTFLRSQGAILGLSPEKGASMLCWAASQDDVDLITRLSQCGLDLSLEDYDGRTALQLAKDSGYRKLYKLIDSLLKTNEAQAQEETPNENSV